MNLMATPVLDNFNPGESEHAKPPERSNSKELDDILAEKRRKIERTLPDDPRAMRKALARDLIHYEATGNRSHT